MLDYQPPRRRDPSTLYQQRLLVNIAIGAAIGIVLVFLLTVLLHRALPHHRPAAPSPATQAIR